MNEATVDPAQGAPSPTSGITTKLILWAACVLIAENWRRTWTVWLFAAAFACATSFLGATILGTTWVRFSWLAAVQAAHFWISAAGYRALLGYGDGLWRMNADFWRYIRASLLILAAVLICMLPFQLLRFVDFTEHRFVAGSVAVLFLLVVLPFLAIYGLRTLDWPVGLLVGECEMTFAESSRRMVGAKLAAFGALIVVGLVLALPNFCAKWLDGVASGDIGMRWLAAGADGAMWCAQFVSGTAIISAVFALTLPREHSLQDADTAGQD